MKKLILLLCVFSVSLLRIIYASDNFGVDKDMILTQLMRESEAVVEGKIVNATIGLGHFFRGTAPAYEDRGVQFKFKVTDVIKGDITRNATIVVRFIDFYPGEGFFTFAAERGESENMVLFLKKSSMPSGIKSQPYWTEANRFFSFLGCPEACYTSELKDWWKAAQPGSPANRKKRGG